VEEDVALSVGAAWIAGQDRSMWRTLRPSAGQAQQWVSVSRLQRLAVTCEQYCRIRPEGLLYDAERDLLAIAKFLVDM